MFSGKKTFFRFSKALLLGPILIFFLTGQASGAGAITRVSTDSDGQQGDRDSGLASISADGRFIAFSSGAANLVPGDNNGSWDVFLKDTQTGHTIRVSTDSAGGQGNADSWRPSISADGRFIAFESTASNLVPADTNSWGDVFIKDTASGRIDRISTDSAGRQGIRRSGYASISPDGRFVAFSSLASNLVPNDANGTWDVLIKDTSTGKTAIVSTDSAGQVGNSWSYMSSITSVSADGRFVAFHSNASNLVPDDTNGVVDVFVKDTTTGHIARVSTDSAGAQGEGESWHPSISADGRYVSFFSYGSNLIAADANGTWDVFLKDTLTGQTSNVSTDSAGGQGNSWSVWPTISADGRYISFVSYASNLVPEDTNAAGDIFIKDTLTGQVNRLSADPAGVQGDGGSYRPSISADGRYVAFESAATNLVPGDTNEKFDVFLSSICFGSRPQLSLTLTRIYWASYNDFLLRRLSTDFSATNTGSATAYGVEAVKYTATDRVSLLTAMPSYLGNIPGGSSQVATLKYKVPPLVLSFETTVHATARDECSNSHPYNGQAKIEVPLLPPVQ